MRLIDADALMERLVEEQRIHVGHDAYQGGLAGAGILIAEAPTVAMGDDHITIKWTPDIDRLAREVAYQGLNTFSFLGKSIREWVEIILEQTTPVWISVKDRLPEEKGWYMVYAPGYSGGSSSGLDSHNGLMFAKWSGKTWSIEVGYHKRPGCVRHWMPLPEPPEEVSGDA